MAVQRRPPSGEARSAPSSWFPGPYQAPSHGDPDWSLHPVGGFRGQQMGTDRSTSPHPDRARESSAHPSVRSPRGRRFRLPDLQPPRHRRLTVGSRQSIPDRCCELQCWPRTGRPDGALAWLRESPVGASPRGRASTACRRRLCYRPGGGVAGRRPVPSGAGLLQIGWVRRPPQPPASRREGIGGACRRHHRRRYRQQAEGSENAKRRHFCGCVRQGRRVPGQGDGLSGASGRACLLPESGVLGLRSAVALLRMPSDVWSGRPVVLVDDAAEDVAMSDGLGADHCHRTRDRLGELKAAVWPCLVVVADVLGEHLVEVSSGDDEEMVEALLADGADEALGVRVRTRRTHRRADALDADRGEDFVEAGGELGVAVADEEPEAPAGIVQIGGEVAGDLSHPWVIGIGGGTEDVDDASLQFDDEQHVVAPQEDRVDVEEVRGHNALGLGGEELGPRWALSPGCRWETVVAQHGRDARLRHADAELLQLADDAEITPPGVLPSQAADQLHGLFGKARTTWSAVRVGPALLDQRAVPAQDRLWADEERSPVFSRNKTGQEGDEGTVGPGEAWTCDLPAKHGQLVAEYENLGVLRRCIRPVDTNDLEHARDEPTTNRRGK